MAEKNDDNIVSFPSPVVEDEEWLRAELYRMFQRSQMDFEGMGFEEKLGEIDDKYNF